MGGKDSKLSNISYDDAVKRVTDTELKRLKDAFKRSSALNGFMTENLFYREVLWDGIPPKLAQHIFRAFGGVNKGLGFKDLLSGLVALTGGSREEKIKLIFGIYSDDSFTCLRKETVDKQILEMEGHVSSSLSALFCQSDQVGFDQFRLWVLQHPDATAITKWLLMEDIALSLSNDIETPTFYQTLAGVTHLAETDISELEKRYWALKSQSVTGRFDLETFQLFIAQSVPERLCQGLFRAFDENVDGHIDFKEMACGISACCRGPSAERQKFCFKIFDFNGDGKLDKAELTSMLEALFIIRLENKTPQELETDELHKFDPEIIAEEILSCQDGDKDGCITMEEYLVWTINNTLSDDLLNVLSQICHVVLGLKPQTREEGEIVMKWLDRETRKPLQPDQVWYLVAMHWWKLWKEYVAYEKTCRTECCNTRLKFSKGKIPNGGLAFDSDSVVMVNVKTNTEEAVCQSRAQPKSFTSSTTSSFTNCLNPSDCDIDQLCEKNSPKMRKKSTSPSVPAKPGAIDNSSLVQANPYKVLSLTMEGGRLRKDVPLSRGRDFELVPEPIWRALVSWYGGSPALPRSVISPSNVDPNPQLELYPINVRLLRHQTAINRPLPTTTFTGMMAGIGGMAMNVSNFASSTTPRRYLAFTAAYSCRTSIGQMYDHISLKLRINKDDIRLWKIHPKDDQNMTLLEDDLKILENTGVEENQQILIEVRNKDLTWPEEMSQLAKNKTLKKDDTPTEQGASGLSNLGNTCFMNAALQCVSNTNPLTVYFDGGLHLYELNRNNAIGMKGHIAQRYGELVKDLWSGTMKTVAPLKLRWTIGKYAPRFNGFQQHDSQELLSFLLDGLHEDLNRVHDKPYAELKDSDGRPDEIVSKEAWDNHLLRNQSIIVDLFHGQLKSQVRCKECGHISVRFDPFNYLSLPLPMDSCIHLELIVIWLNGSTPTKYGLRLNMDEKYKTLKKELSDLTNIPACQLLLVEVMGPIVKSLPQDKQKIKTTLTGQLFAYELPLPEEIKPITAEEEKCQGQNNIGLSEIQRGLKQKVGIRNSPAKSPMMNGRIAHADTPGINGSDTNGDNVTECDNLQHSRNDSSLSSCDSLPKNIGDLFDGFIIGVHRKMNLMDAYFLSCHKTRPSLFGTPIILPCDDQTTNQDLYEFVWLQVTRLVSPLPPTEAKNSSNHAQDCDDSLGYEYPFTLRVIQKDGLSCARCPWYRSCRGCELGCNGDMYDNQSYFIAIDWEPTALHLRYQTTHERFNEEHSSVEESRKKQVEPIDLDTCLQAFTKEEELGEDELYYCSKCKKHCLASKKLDIWKLPPILIINLKRFQFLTNRWVKSHKIVKFPTDSFDPTKYVVRRKKSELNKKHNKDSRHQKNNSCNNNQSPVSNGNCNTSKNCCDKLDANQSCMKNTNPSIEHDFDSVYEDYKESIYNLYAMSCHNGILGGGHYVAYAKNPNKKWYCYNDSSCKEVTVNQLDTNAAYILFYERQNLSVDKFLPDIKGREPDTQEIVDEFDSDFKKMCVVQ